MKPEKITKYKLHNKIKIFKRGFKDKNLPLVCPNYNNKEIVWKKSLTTWPNITIKILDQLIHLCNFIIIKYYI